ncbi:hypothetical protein [Microbulbifer agarilyticus]|uniref:hypothetical protein n=1 Tax=Microbulbifer agarilyticus TaxID=260552 RepID=UPI001C97993A|nr:hypothetical protein [Microbulbifer agarilyticus]MBY6190758.1 hypothetical protein [Microbulbifer agarilyticus]MBY6211363.1 hypothetical protein [Microbulbifer agarilyticus]MCA0893620.1 hypothetical protein [Microbulbifer agarilyticus]
MFKKITLVAAIAGLGLVSGCASILSDSNYPVTINSNPAGANFVVVNEAGFDVHTGVTPDTITLSASDGFFSSASYVVKFQMAGFEEQSFQLSAGMDGWYIGNILFGGLIGMLIVDPATGAMWKLPESANVSLAPVTAATGLETLSIASVHQLTDEAKAQLIPLN